MDTKFVIVFTIIALCGVVLLEDGITGMFAASESCCMGPTCPAAQLCNAVQAPAQAGSAAAFWLGIMLCGLAVFYLFLHARHEEHDF